MGWSFDSAGVTGEVGEGVDEGADLAGPCCEEGL